jgi:hypothetical protein
MSRRDDLIALRDAVQAGTARPHEIFNAFDTPCQDMAMQINPQDATSAYKGSVDAALAFLASILPSFHPGMSRNVHTGYWYAWVQTKERNFDSHEETPARALLLATLNALIAQVDQ